jgi:hypothetical protein
MVLSSATSVNKSKLFFFTYGDKIYRVDKKKTCQNLNCDFSEIALLLAEISHSITTSLADTCGNTGCATHRPTCAAYPNIEKTVKNSFA